ncbi:MAG: DNA-3-methyladenine glycosylase I [Myxococcota bacterium]|nr:DNA-3-methyladenine glycosylase I [Myxococcota bacterium]
MTSRLPRGLHADEHGVVRCAWTGDHDDYRDYHDHEWGRPQANAKRLFEKICLEGFQSGLSWLTILRKRDAFRRAFRDFDIEKVSRFNSKSVERLLADPGIVRHRGKIEATIGNARCARRLIEEFGSLPAFVWQFQPTPGSRPGRINHSALRKLTESDESRSMSRTLRERGWRFVGPTTLYAFMQSVGIVNDHLEGCSFREEVEEERRNFKLPSRR